MTKDKYVSIEIALKLKSLGFDEVCDAYYRFLLGSNEPLFFQQDGMKITNSECVNSIHGMMAAPTYDAAMRFIDAYEKKQFKWVHPEMQEDEIFIINVKKEENWRKPNFIESLRIGEVAYTTGGKEIVAEMKPLFGKLKK